MAFRSIVPAGPVKAGIAMSRKKTTTPVTNRDSGHFQITEGKGFSLARALLAACDAHFIYRRPKRSSTANFRITIPREC